MICASAFLKMMESVTIPAPEAQIIACIVRTIAIHMMQRQ